MKENEKNKRHDTITLDQLREGKGDGRGVTVGGKRG